MAELVLPPAYRAVRVSNGRSAMGEARAAAIVGGEDGTLFWGDRVDRLDAALLLQPDRSRRDMLPIIYVAALAFVDALGAFAPPPAPISFAWPGGILIDGASAGAVSLVLPTSAVEAVPNWAVLGLDLALAVSAEEPGRAPDRTSIAEEDFEGFSVAAQIESFSRHFLAWLSRWDADGTEPILTEWSRRAFAAMPGATIEVPGGGRAMPLGLDPAGNLRVRQGARERILTLEVALVDRIIHG